ncbi:cysteine-rich receptor-like protein kinase, partial [Tanacetum coccineum]
ETKLESIDDSTIRFLWPNNFTAFVTNGPMGASGGILTMWDSRVFTMELNMTERNLVAVVGSYQEERSGCRFNSGEADVFNDFIARTGLFDFPLCGRHFTRFDRDGIKASKLDRFLVSHSFFDLWIDACVSVPTRTFSDHCPIMIKVGSPNFGPKPFKVFDKWLCDGDFKDLISSSWASFPSLLPADICLKNKLKNLRIDIKRWTSSCLKEQNRVRDDLNNNLLEWDKKAEEGMLSEYDIIKREEWLLDLYQLDQLHRENLKQKGRFRWAVEGDENSRFFHSILNSRFKESNHNMPSFHSLLLRKLSSSDACLLESPFSLEEVKGAVWDCAGSKAPGPDGFNFNFIKSFWDVIKVDLWNCIQHFESTGSLANGCNPSFIVLAPKKPDPIGFSDYRPISLIGCVYKVISKLLASRLARVIDSIISPNQSTFISGRNILDGCLIANEIIRMASLEDQKLLLFKIDFEKAFDSVNWNFLLSIMRQMGFRIKWRNWIASCLSSASISVLINGSPSKEFKMERGLRQGDPLSPFLFLLIAEALQVTIVDACNNGI